MSKLEWWLLLRLLKVLELIFGVRDDHPHPRFHHHYEDWMHGRRHEDD